jgi:hypothetical protein
MIAPGGTAVYSVTVSRVGNGDIDVYLSIAGLPAGATATFSPAMVHFTGPAPLSQTATLTISTTSAVLPGVYDFTVTGDDGASHNKKSGVGILNIGIGLAGISMMPDFSTKLFGCGYAGQSYVVQATTNLSAPIWIPISTNTADAHAIFTCIDLDARTCPCRFYRLGPAE